MPIVLLCLSIKRHKGVKLYCKGKSALKTVLIFLFVTLAAQSATILFVTAPGANLAGTNVDAQVTFITSQNQMEIRVANLQQEVGTVLRTISALDWTFGSALPVMPTQIARSGDMITMDPTANGNRLVTYTLAPNGYATFPTDPWKSVVASTQIAGGMEISAISGSTVSETIIGPPDANNLYQSKNALRGYNPFLQTSGGSYVSWTLAFDPLDHVTAATTVTRVRLTWGAAFATGSELDLIPDTPEPAPLILCLSGLAVILLARRKRT